MEAKPFISFVIAVRNGVTTLGRCLDSVIAQSIIAHELVVIDGGSTDGTVDILQERSPHIAFWRSAPDNGIASAWNEALQHVRGEWILFLGADDFLWNETVVADVVPMLRSVYPPHAVGLADVVLTKGAKPYVRLSAHWNRQRFLDTGLYFSHQGVFHHRSLFNEVGRFDESFRFAADYELLLRYLAEKDPVYLPNVLVAGAEDGGVSSNDRNALAVIREIACANNKHRFSALSTARIRSLLAAHIKYALHRLLGSSRASWLINFVRPLVGRRRRV